ncbi:short neuropeptide F [Megachile rotundata]|uniref:short neuropeptide F n=1 Tax=Megachile rotundata TaxID=143995 RepID=UPI000258D3CE|nr:PREDICTED: short neuropeptide F-like [Megachile rotundata]
MLSASCMKAIFIFAMIGFVFGVESYMDYGDEISDKTPAENIHELYRLLLQRAGLENPGYNEAPFEHLMIRKSQRSPSLRLRFGRSDPHLAMRLLSRQMSAIAPPRFEDN